MFIKAKVMWLIILTGISITEIGIAKVAYIPILEVRSGTEFEDSILTVNLESGRTLKKIMIGAGVGPVFITELGDFLYAAATHDNKIVQIDTAQLEITATWLNLPIEPEQIVLNQTEDKLLFTQRGEDSIYQLDIETGSVDLVTHIAGFQSLHYSENLEYLIFYTSDDVTDENKLLTYEADTFNLIHETVASSTSPAVVSNEGMNYFLSIFGYGMQSRSLVDNSLNWEFRHGSGLQGPIGEVSETFTAYFLFNENTLLLNGNRGGSYLVNTIDGTGSRISQLANPFNHQNAQINNFTFLQSNRPEQIICPPIAPCPDVGTYYPMTLTIQNHSTETEEVIFTRNESGNIAIGRYIGDLFYTIPKIPVFGHFSYLLLTFFSILFLTYRTGRFSRIS